MRRKPHRSQGQTLSRAAEPRREARVSRAAPAPRSRRDPAQKRARETVDAIIEAAGQLLVTQGRASVTTNAVAERAGVSIGSLYQYFSNKEAIFAALQKQHRHQMMPLIHHALASLADPAVDIVERTVVLMRAMVELHRGDPARMRVLTRELDERMSSEEIDQFTDQLARILGARGRCGEDEVRPVAWLLCMTVSHIGRALVHYPPALDSETLLAGLSRMLRGLLGASGPGRQGPA
jgi:AcrR family transcriptional regulator